LRSRDCDREGGETSMAKKKKATKKKKK